MKQYFSSLQERVQSTPLTNFNLTQYFTQANIMDELHIRGREALIRATIWAFVGSLYGMIFIFFYNLSLHWALPVSPLLVAGTLAGTIAALIYSSMSLAVIVTPISSVVCLFYVVSNGGHIDLANMSQTVAVVGALTGAIYGLKVKNSRVFRADAKTLAGVSAGALVALLIVLLTQLIPNLPLTFVVAFACLLTGSLYVTLVPFYVHHYHELLPPVADGAMVGAGTSIFIALLFFVMISGVTPEAAGSLSELAEQIRASFAYGALGGMIGGGLSGFLSGLLLRKWQDL